MARHGPVQRGTAGTAQPGGQGPAWPTQGPSSGLCGWHRVWLVQEGSCWGILSAWVPLGRPRPPACTAACLAAHLPVGALLLPSLPVCPCSPRTPHHVPRPWPHSRHLQDPAGCSPLQLPLPAHPQGRTAGAPRAQQGTPGTSARSREAGTALSQAGCQQRAGSARGWQLPAPDRWSCNRTPDGFGKGKRRMVLTRWLC